MFFFTSYPLGLLGVPRAPGARVVVPPPFLQAVFFSERQRAGAGRPGAFFGWC